MDAIVWHCPCGKAVMQIRPGGKPDLADHRNPYNPASLYWHVASGTVFCGAVCSLWFHETT